MKTYITIVVATLACFQAALARSFEPYIAGGEEAVPHSHPHQVALLDEYGLFSCGGSLISDKWVITAAHCAYQFKYTPKPWVLCGAHDLSEYEETTRRVRVISFTIHEEYSSETLKNDIALLQLKTSLAPYIKDGKFIKPIRLPKVSDSGRSYSGSKVTMTGWGKIKDIRSPRSPVLKWLNTTVLSDSYCKSVYSPNWDNQICTSPGYGNGGPCYGDSGGPLIEVESDGERTLIGIASFTEGEDCMAGYPSGFTQISSYMDWIKTATANEVHIRP